MNTELQKARQHYDTLPPHVKVRATAKHLLSAIQIAERTSDALCQSVEILEKEFDYRPDDEHGTGWADIKALARVSKPEGQ